VVERGALVHGSTSASPPIIDRTAVIRVRTCVGLRPCRQPLPNGQPGPACTRAVIVSASTKRPGKIRYNELLRD